MSLSKQLAKLSKPPGERMLPALKDPDLSTNSPISLNVTSRSSPSWKPWTMGSQSKLPGTLFMHLLPIFNWYCFYRDFDIGDTIQCLRYYAGWADKIIGQVSNYPEYFLTVFHFLSMMFGTRVSRLTIRPNWLSLVMIQLESAAKCECEYFSTKLGFYYHRIPWNYPITMWSVHGPSILSLLLSTG